MIKGETTPLPFCTVFWWGLDPTQYTKGRYEVGNVSVFWKADLKFAIKMTCVILTRKQHISHTKSYTSLFFHALTMLEYISDIKLLRKTTNEMLGAKKLATIKQIQILNISMFFNFIFALYKGEQ